MIDKEETMHKTVSFVWACFALLAVACSRKDNPEQPAAESIPVAFGVEAPTKAGFVGEVDPLTIRATGFGVDGTSDAELLYIPGASSADPLSLTVRYHVIERNAGQALGYRSMSITKTVEPDAHFTAGTTTTLALHLQIPVSD